jgi:hypothetical protein
MTGKGIRSSCSGDWTVFGGKNVQCIRVRKPNEPVKKPVKKKKPVKEDKPDYDDSVGF